MSKHTLRLPLLVAAVAVGAAALPPAAHAWWRGGVFFGFPVVAPYAYVPPYYYAPPPVAYGAPYAGYGGYGSGGYGYGGYGQPPAGYPAPPAEDQSSARGPACHAGPYVCPLETALPAGAQCTCPTNNGRAAGRVG